MLNRFTEIPENPVTVLVRPPINRWKLYKWYAPLGSREPSFGLLYIASYIHTNGYEVHILDGELLDKLEFVRRIKLLKPDVIGITSTTFSFNSASTVAKQLRSQFPNSLILLGGSHASALSNDSLLRIPSLDGVIVGEGEETVLEIIQKRNPHRIDGLVWRQTSESTIHINKPRDIVANLDKYSINWKLLEGFPKRYAPPYQSKKRNSAGLVVSRGCFYDCSFCTATRIFGKKIRFHSPEYVINLMSELENEYGINDFYFHDDYFPADPYWMKQFCSMLIKQKKSYSWSCASRVETLSNEILFLMKKSGCRQIGIGVESGSQKVLDKILKKIYIPVLSEGLSRISLAGIDIKGYFILDTPCESFNDLLKTLKLIFKLNFSHVQFNYYVPLPGSRDYEHNSASEKQWNKMSLQQSLGYSNIFSFLYPIIEVSFYSISYLKIFINRVKNEVFNFRTKLSA